MNENNGLHEWFESYPSPITVCDVHGIIVAMNNASRNNFAKRGGGSLIGTSLFECHPESANKKIKKMLQSQQADTYIVEHGGKKRLVHQAPWYKQGEFGGLIETIIDLAGDIEIRKKS